jgi:3-deoxy-D-manno-octulosonic-acid transferase
MQPKRELMLREIYSFLFFFITPFLRLREFFISFKKTKRRLKERQGFSTHPKENKKVVWFHGASVGESLSLLPVIEYIQQIYPETQILMTTGTITSSLILPKKLPPGSVHQFIPFDHITYVNRFLDYWNPSMVFWAEADFWPNLIIKIADRSIPIILLNGRLSEKSFRRWLRYPPLIKVVIQKFKIIFAQTSSDAKRFQRFGALSVYAIGNLKYYANPLKTDPEIISYLKDSFKERKIILAASTHKKEEKIIAEVHQALKKIYPSLVTIIVPRHPSRALDIRKMLENLKLKVIQKSLKEDISADLDIYLADTLGELGSFYSFCPISFLGGSMVPVGGHNLIEPALLKSAIIVGPYMYNNVAIFKDFQNENACLVSHTTTDLINHFKLLLENPKQVQELSENAYKLVLKGQAGFQELIKMVKPLIDKTLKNESPTFLE